MKKNALIFLVAVLSQLHVFSQSHIVKGAVKDATSKAPVFGVSVGVKNTSIGSVTNFDGEFAIAVPDSVKTLVFKLLGYKSKEAAVSDNMTVLLQADVVRLDETVVTANAIQREKRSLGYSTQQVSGEELTAGQNTSAISSLQGKVSGINITTTTGAPGGSTRIVLRGGTSLTGNNQALMVVDGVPIDNSNFGSNDGSGTFTGDDLNNQVDYGNRGNDINPDDIESISVLKGPAAAALYGSRASNGAIIITTKHGRKAVDGVSKTDITFSSSLTFSNVLKLPTFQNTYGEGDVYPGRDPKDRRENFSWGLPFDGNYRPWGQVINGTQRVKPYSAIPDNVKDFFNTGTTVNNNLSLSGGTDKSTYYLSLNAQNNKGIVPTTSYDKYGVRFNGTTELSNYFTSSIALNYTNIASNLGSGGQKDASIYDNLIQQPRDIPITDLKNDNAYNGYDDATGKYGYYGAYTTNPYFVLNNFKNSNAVDRIQGNFTLAYTKFKWITISDRLGGDIYSDRRYQKWKKFSYTPYDAYYAGNDRVYQGKYSEDIYNQNEITNDLMISAKHDFGKDIKVTALVGHNVRSRKLVNTYGQTNDQGGLAIADYYNLANSNGPALTTSTMNQRRLVGVYGEVNLAYKNSLFLGVTARNDWSSTLPVEHRSFFYPSVNASWVFTELLNDSSSIKKILSYGKLRGGIASVGNDAGAYLTSSIFSKTSIQSGFGTTQFPFNGINGYSQGDRLGNNDIKPEITTAYEIGTELGFLQDRIGVDFTVYQSTSKNQIINVPLSNATGFTSKTINAGEIQNKGVELLIRATPVSTASGLKWDVYGTYTKNVNKVVSIQEGINQITLGGFSRMAIVAAVGEPYGTFYGVDLLKDGAGHVVVDSATGLPITTASSVKLGSYQPKFIASLGTSVSYKGFKLSVLFDTKQGGYFYSHTKGTMDFVGTAEETVEGGRGDRVWANSVYKDYQGNYVTNSSRTYNVEDYYTNKIPDSQHIIDASYVKLREVSLTYQLPLKLLSKTPFGNITVGVFGNNLFIWTSVSNKYSDPEMNSSGASNVQGFEFAAQPSQRNYGFNIRATF